MIETRGRRVLIRDEDGERVCFLAGHRAVIGDRVQWVEARGSGGKIVGVEARDTMLRRMDSRGKDQVLAANLGGLLVVMSAREPGFRPSLLHRYLTTVDREGLAITVVLNKVDLGIPDDVLPHLDWLAALGVDVLHTSAESGRGVEAIATLLAERAAEGLGPMAMVGSSGVGKTSLIAVLLPDDDVGPVGEISEYWGTGRHTTTSSRLFALPGGGVIADSPGIRNFTPAIHDPEDVRLHFPVVRDLRCAFRDCLHRLDEQGCTAEEEVPAFLLDSYRHLLADVQEVAKVERP